MRGDASEIADRIAAFARAGVRHVQLVVDPITQQSIEFVGTAIASRVDEPQEGELGAVRAEPGDHVRDPEPSLVRCHPFGRVTPPVVGERAMCERGR